MNSNWQDFLGARGAHFDQAVVSDFGDLAAELAAARDATIVAPLLHLGLIECAGDDARTFLHNQLTSDVNHLDPAAAQHAGWCTAKGRLLASFLLYRHEAGYRALLSADLLKATQKRLQMYVLRSKVNLADLGDGQVVVGVAGANAAAALTHAGLPAPGKVLACAAFADGVVIHLDATRFVVAVSSAAAQTLWSTLAERARPVGTPAWRWLDVEAGLPLITDATREAFVPQMIDFDKIGAVSFHKGCYPGQEIVARTQYLGKVKRHLYRIHADNVVVAGSAIYAPQNPEHPCGMIANAAPAPDGGYRALAVIQEGFVAANELALGAADGPRVTAEAVNVD